MDNEGKSNRRALSIHIRNCSQALKDVDTCLKRYSNMSAIDKLLWAVVGRDEVKDLEPNLSSFVTQLTGFFAGLTIKGRGVVYQKQETLRSSIARVEIALERAVGNHKTAVKEAMIGLHRSRLTPKCTVHYEEILSDYAKEMSRSTSFTTPRARTPDGRSLAESKDGLGVPAANRAKSADSTKGSKDMGNAFKNKTVSANRGPRYTLDCSQIQIKSGHLSPLT